MKEDKRNYGIDLLRIVSMFMIMLFHILGDGGLLEAVSDDTVKREICTFIEMSVFSNDRYPSLIPQTAESRSNVRRYRAGR